MLVFAVNKVSKTDFGKCIFPNRVGLRLSDALCGVSYDAIGMYLEYTESNAMVIERRIGKILERKRLWYI
jgi:hypothetical protein